LLGRAGIRFGLLISATVMAEQGPQIREVLERIAPGNPIPLIEAEHPAAALSILRTLKKGITLLAYLDGFAGTVLTEPAKRERVRFLGQHLWVRRGIPYLAHRAGVPLYPMLNFRKDDASIEVFQGRILQPEGVTREQFVSHSLQGIFDFLGSLLIHYPEQWETWLYLHEHVSPERCHRRLKIPPKRRYGLLKVDGSRYLMDKQTYEVRKLTGHTEWNFY